MERVSLDVHASERFELLGPSGCGKTTPLRTAAGFALSTEGRVLLDGVPVDGPGPDRMVVFQEFDQLYKRPCQSLRIGTVVPLIWRLAKLMGSAIEARKNPSKSTLRELKPGFPKWF